MALDKQTQTTILIKGAIKGSQKAFSDLIDLYWDDVIKLLKHKRAPEHALEDIALVSFTKAFEKLDTFNSEYTFKTWISTISQNNLIDFFRQQKKSTISIDEVFTDETGNEFKMDFKSKTLSPEEEFIETQENSEIRRLINILPKHYSEVLKLRFIDNCSYKEISIILNIPINNVKIKLLRGRKLLIYSIEENSELG